jgi:putative ABC transport system substrate-binding protein
MVSRRRIAIALGTSALVAPLVSWAQLAKKIPLVGVLSPGWPPPSPPLVAVGALQQGLRDSGYVEGETVALQYRYASGKPETLPGLALDLVRRNVDVLLAIGSPSLNAAKSVAGALPIVAIDLESDPVASGLVASLAKPGGTITGLFLDFADMTGKWLELLTEAVPAARSAAVLWDATTGPFQLQAITAAAKTRSIDLEVVKFQQAAEIDAVLASAMKRRPAALIQLSSPVVFLESARIAKFTQTNRLPAISMFTAFPQAGGLMSFGPNLPIFFRRSGLLVDKILRGAKAADIPLERPTTFELFLNMKTAKALDIKIPQSILVRADKVIE